MNDVIMSDSKLQDSKSNPMLKELYARVALHNASTYKNRFILVVGKVVSCTGKELTISNHAGIFTN
jgi:hypothetical protein